jgi:class 3 adenylate cyclase
VSYRALAHVFNGDQAFLDAAREELTFRRLARDEHGQGLAWTAQPMPGLATNGDLSPTQLAPPAAQSLASVAAPAAQPLTAAARPMAPAAPVPEDIGQAGRRQLTVMFCDLADSTVLAGRLDAEDLREVIRSYQSSAAEVVQRFSGHIAQYLGDGLLVYLGWPEAHEDDASRAVRAGLEIVEAITTTLNPRLARDKGVQLAVRVGIHTGPVVVGAMGGGGRRENLATGETVNIAARLEGLASPNTVVISQATSRLVRGTFALEALGPTTLKGVAEPMPVYRVLGLAEVAEADPLAVSAPFVVGRGEEVGLLRRLWEQCKEGLGHAVLVSGTAGLGKSTLVEVLRAHVRKEGLPRIVFRCSPYHLNVPLYPLVTHLESLLQPWSRRSHMTPLTLNRLERPQVEALITHRAGGKTLPAEVVSHIVAKTDGVPLYVEELTKMLLDSSLLRAEGDEYVLTGPLSAVSIPDTLQDSLMARLDQLRAAKEVAQLGAVLGREFAYDVLQAVAPMDESALQDGLGKLEQAELLYQRGRPPRARYLFKHALIQDAAYASLLRSARQQVHANVAQALMAKLPELAETQPELLAHHYAQAGLLAQALDRWQAAAERAVHRSAYVEAVHSIDQALAQLVQLPPDEARDRSELTLLAMKLGPLQPVKGYSSPEIDAASGRALTLCRSFGDRTRLFPILYARWALQYVAGRNREGFVLSREYLDAARGAEDDAALIVGQRIHAAGLFIRGDVEGARGLACDAVHRYVPERHRPLITRFGQDLRAQSLIYVALSQALLGKIDEARALGDEAIELAREHRLGFWKAIVTPFLLEGEEAERAVRSYRREFNAGLTVPQMLCHVADSYVTMGRTAGHGGPGQARGIHAHRDRSPGHRADAGAAGTALLR